MRHGDNDAYSAFCRKYTPRVLGFLRHKLRLAEQDAEDVWQEGLLKLSQSSLQHYEADKRDFFSWLMLLLKCMVCDRWRREGTQKRGGHCITVSGDQPLWADAPEGATIFEALEDETQVDFARTREAVAESLEAMLRDYPGEEAKLYLHWFWAQDVLDQKEFAASVGKTPNQWRYIKECVEAHLRKRWDKDL